MKKILKVIMLVFILAFAFGMTVFADGDEQVESSLEGTMDVELLDPPATLVRDKLYTGTIRVTNNTNSECDGFFSAHIGVPDPEIFFDDEAYGFYEFEYNRVHLKKGEFADINMRYLAPSFLDEDVVTLMFYVDCSYEPYGPVLERFYSRKYDITLTGEVIKPSIDEINITPEANGQYKISTDKYTLYDGYEIVHFAHFYKKASSIERGFGEILALEGDSRLQSNYVYWMPPENGRYKITSEIQFKYEKDGFIIMGGTSKTIDFTHGTAFVDVNTTDWFAGAVDFVFEKGIMTGMNEDTFGPGIELSRAQFATILYRMQNSPQVEYSPEAFPDVKDGQFYTEPAMWAKSTGVILGYDNGNFGPSDEITREQMAVMMYRYANYLKLDTSARGEISGFPDAGKVSGFAGEAIKWAVGKGLITGDQGNINPQGKASRAQCATIIMRYMNAYDL